MACSVLQKRIKWSTLGPSDPLLCRRSTFTPPKQVEELYMLSRLESHFGISQSSECSLQQLH